VYMCVGVCVCVFVCVVVCVCVCVCVYEYIYIYIYIYTSVCERERKRERRKHSATRRGWSNLVSAQLRAPHVEYAAENSETVKQAPMRMPAKHVVMGGVQPAVLDDLEVFYILEPKNGSAKLENSRAKERQIFRTN
jgi:hypothetical protein